MPELHAPQHPVRFVTAASLFDGHDAAINIMRRILQSQGAEVVHLGHNRSVDDVVTAALEEDVQGVAVSSYQGGHVEYFTYLVEQLRERDLGQVRVCSGGAGQSSPPDEPLRGFRLASQDSLGGAAVALDPARRKGGGALLGDRIRMNSIGVSNVYFRSLATRGAAREVPEVVGDVIAAC